MSQHSDYSPSRLSRIILCPGSVPLCNEVPKLPTTSYAKEGTLLHSYMEQTLDMWPSEIDQDAWEIDHQIAVEACMEYVQQHVQLDEPGIKKFIEIKVELEGLEEVFGTLDFCVLCSTGLHIFDWKFGRGVEVEAKDNPQLLAYLSGALYTLSRSGISIPEGLPMFVHVVQPRISNYQWEKVTHEELEQFRQEVRKAITLSKGKNPPYNPGPVQCRWCDAAAQCKARISQVQLDVEAVYAGVVDIENNRADISDIIKLYAKKADIEQALKQLHQFVFLELCKGREDLGYKLVRGRSNRAWSAEATVDAISEAVPELDFEDIIDPPKLKSPAQLEKLVPKDKRDLLQAFIVKPEGALSVAPESSSKPAVRINNPEEAYAGLTDGDAEE